MSGYPVGACVLRTRFHRRPAADRANIVFSQSEITEPRAVSDVILARLHSEREERQVSTQRTLTVERRAQKADTVVY